MDVTDVEKLNYTVTKLLLSLIVNDNDNDQDQGQIKLDPYVSNKLSFLLPQYIKALFILDMGQLHIYTFSNEKMIISRAAHTHHHFVDLDNLNCSCDAYMKKNIGLESTRDVVQLLDSIITRLCCEHILAAYLWKIYEGKLDRFVKLKKFDHVEDWCNLIEGEL